MERRLTDDQMVKPVAMAPFEAAECFARWMELMGAEAQAQGTTLDQTDDEAALIVTPDVCRGFGPPWPLLGERPRAFGDRCAAVLFTLIKEI